MYSRPKPGDSEDDILALQEAYMAEKKKNKDLQPAAKVVNLRKHKNSDDVQYEPKISKYTDDTVMKKDTKVRFCESTTVLGENMEEEPLVDNKTSHIDDKVYYPTLLPFVLGDIVEKNTDLTDRPVFDPLCVEGFPKAKKRDSSVTSERKSIFSQQSKKKNKMDVDAPTPTPSVMAKDTKIKNDDILNSTVILQGKDATDIHVSNKAILDEMTEEEILKEKETLAAMIDPRLLDFVKSLRQKKIENNLLKEEVKIEKESDSNMNTTEAVTIKEEMLLQNNEVINDLSDNAVISHPDLLNWVNFDTLEKDKLQWIKNIHETISSVPIDKPYEARFGFKGNLLPYTSEYNEETKTLFHHGEEPHRPGYSIDELFKLSRSVITQQRSLALNTLAGILEYYSAGIYTGIIQIPITKIFFVLRFSLDENIPIVLEPTLRALRNMFYNRIDEACLDFLLGSDKGLKQPRLLSTKSEIEDTETAENELKDFHLADLDLIRGVLRTDILPRLRYILSIIKPNFICVEYCLQILIRIARDSVDNAESFFCVEGLMEYIFENFIPKFISNRKLFQTDAQQCKVTCSALKLIRVLVSQSLTIAESCNNKFHIFQSLMCYTGSIEIGNVDEIKVQIEAFFLWSAMLRNSIGLQELTDVKGLLLKMLDIHTKGTNLCDSHPIMQQHTSALITLLTNGIIAASRVSPQGISDQINDISILISIGLQKWSAQLCTVEKYTASHLKLISSALLYSGTVLQMGHQNNSSFNSIRNMLKSKGFLKITSKLIESSNLLSDTKIAKEFKDTSLPGLCSHGFDNDYRLPSTLIPTSPMYFVSSLSKYIFSANNKELSMEFIQSRYVYEYIAKISYTSRLSVPDNWFTKIELDLLANCLCLSAHLQFPEDQKEIIYNVAFKLSYVLSPEYKSNVEFIFQNIVFKKEWFTAERLLRNLNMSETDDILNNLGSILECYISTLKLNSGEDMSSLTVSNWDQPILPRDWMFMPILGLYSKSQDQITAQSAIATYLAKALEEQTKNVVMCCLKWIFVSEVYFPEITAEINLTDRFCRLSCVFLCDNSLFLDEHVKVMLQKCFKIIFDLEKSTSVDKLNFDKTPHGINNFQDLYTQLVDQFQAVSYGDSTFAACVLAPLAQRHNIKWRNLVWSEYAGCLRALNCPESMLCYTINEYIHPAELDFSLLKCYHRALVSNSLRKDTTAYRIASHHVTMAKNRQIEAKNIINMNKT